MKAQVLHRFGDVENFRLEDVPVPEPGPGYVRVKVMASSVNPVDYKVRRAGPPFAPELPAVLGFDVAGAVDAVGPDVTGFAVGDAVYGCAGGVRGEGGAHAEYMLADARLLAPKPEALSFREAAAPVYRPQLRVVRDLQKAARKIREHTEELKSEAGRRDLDDRHQLPR